MAENKQMLRDLRHHYRIAINAESTLNGALQRIAMIIGDHIGEECAASIFPDDGIGVGLESTSSYVPITDLIDMVKNGKEITVETIENGYL